MGERMNNEQVVALTDDALNEALERACGWTRCDCYGHRAEGAWHKANSPFLHHYGMPPDYAYSIDAQQAPGGPEELARQRGWTLRAISSSGFNAVAAWPSMTRNVWAWPFDATDKPEARLRAEALLLALEAGV